MFIVLPCRLEDVPSRHCSDSAVPPGVFILQLLWLPATAQVAPGVIMWDTPVTTRDTM